MILSRLAPRRSELPVIFGLGLVTMFFLHFEYPALFRYFEYHTTPFWHAVHRCDSLGCIAFDLAEPVVILLLGLLGSFSIWRFLRRALDPQLGLTDRFPRVFDPPTDVVAVLVSIAVLSVVTWFAVEYGVLYTAIGPAVFYALYCPFLNAVTLLELFDVAIPFTITNFVAAMALLSAAQVAWWYILAYGIVGCYRRLAAYS